MELLKGSKMFRIFRKELQMLKKGLDIKRHLFLFTRDAA